MKFSPKRIVTNLYLNPDTYKKFLFLFLYNTDLNLANRHPHKHTKIIQAHNNKRKNHARY